MKSRTPRVNMIANPATNPATIPRIQSIRENPTGLKVPESITLSFITRLAGVCPVPAVIAAQIIHPIPSVTVIKIASTKYEPSRTQGLASETPGGRLLVVDDVDDVDIDSSLSNGFYGC